MNDPVLQEIKDRLNIAEVISGYIQIKKAGGNFRAVCPFHNEKTPSLMISPGKQIWHCFGCGAGGDVFGFVMQYENLEFKEALKLLADKAGVKLPEYRPKDQKTEDEKERLYRINDFAARFYHQILLKDQRGKEALSYLQKRGLTLSTIQKWQIGFAPEDFHILEKALAAKKVYPADLVKAGVSSKNERGQVYDRFRGRITFPIFDYSGKAVGFSARILKDDGKSAKYVNSPETLIYSKSKILFGLNFAKNEIRKKDEAVVVEGQMDCISAHQAGFGNVVASSGTALTEEQLVLLSRLTKNLKFCFDSDAAGLIATRRAVSLYLGKDFTIKIMELQGGKDPDELIKKDPQLWEKQVKNAPLFLDYYLSQAFAQFDPDSVEQKKQVTKDLLPLLSFLTDPLEQDHYIQKLAEKLNTTEKVLRDALAKLIKPKPGSVAVQKTSDAKYVKSQPDASALEKQVLGGLLTYQDFLDEVKPKLEEEDFENAEIRGIVKAMMLGKDKESGKGSSVAKEAVFMVESQLDDFDRNEAALKRELKKAFALLKLSAIKRRQQQLSSEIKRTETSADKEKLMQLNQLFVQLSEKRMEFEKLV